MKDISSVGLILNPNKCKFGSKETKFWGTVNSSEGMKPDPVKIDALKYTAPTNKDELISFLCIMQSNSDFIENFAQNSGTLRELICHVFLYFVRPLY